MFRITFFFPPQLPRVHHVLPDDVTAWRHGNDWREVGVGYPDGKYRVLLAESLATTDIIAQASAHQLPDTELPGARDPCKHAERKRPHLEETDDLFFHIQSVFDSCRKVTPKPPVHTQITDCSLLPSVERPLPA